MRARVDDPRPIGGRREALAALARRHPEDYRRIYQALREGTAIDEVTVAEWAPQWLRLRERVVRPGTHQADRAAVDKWIVPTIGSRPLAGLLQADVRAVHEAVESAGLAASSAQRVHAVLRKLCTDAADEGHSVPERTLRTKGPGAGNSQRQALSVDDARRILDVAMLRADGSRWVAALLQGMRPAEALGLRWSSLNLDRGVMRIEWQLKSLPYRVAREPASGFRVPRNFEAIHLCRAYHLVRPKTSAGVRTVPLVPWLRTELAAWGTLAPRSPYGLVWPASNGDPQPQAEDRAEWKRIAKEADVWITQQDGSNRAPLLYEARHTAATLLMASGADEQTITAIVGHSKIASTSAYLHTDETRKLAALETVGAQLGICQ